MFPQGLKPLDGARLMSELKLRPPKKTKMPGFPTQIVGTPHTGGKPGATAKERQGAQPGMAVPRRKERNTGLKTGHYKRQAKKAA
jgi:hypothetical protein